MQRYNVLLRLPNNEPFSSSVCYDSLAYLRQTAGNGPILVANRTSHLRLRSLRLRTCRIPKYLSQRLLPVPATTGWHAFARKVWMHRHWWKTRDARYRDKRSSHQGMWSAQHRRFPTSDIREKKKCYSRGYAIARCQAKTTLKSYWHELRDHQEYKKKMAMKTGTSHKKMLDLFCSFRYNN